MAQDLEEGGCALESENCSRLAGHLLLPHERWAASSALRRREVKPELKSQAFDRNYGPVGVALATAGLFTGLLGGIIAIVGIGILLVSGGKYPIVSIGYIVLCAGGILQIPAAIRTHQATVEGKKFRGDRPVQQQERKGRPPFI